MAASTAPRAVAQASYTAPDSNVNETPPVPKGTCNFRDLAGGATAPVCGCARFWPNAGHSLASGSSYERAWCFCGHHACFHDIENPRHSVERVSPSSRQSIVDYGSYGRHARPIEESKECTIANDKTAGLGIHTETQEAGAEAINMRVWEALNAFARDQENGPQANYAHSLPSTAPASTIEPLRRSPVSSMRQQRQPSRSMGPPITVPFEQALLTTDDYSATEAATPSAAGTPDIKVGPRPNSHFRDSPSNIRPALFQNHILQPRLRNAGPACPSAAQSPVTWGKTALRAQSKESSAPNTIASMTISDMRNLVQSLGRRIDALENLSFSHAPIDVIQDKFELFEARILDLEYWRVDRDNALQQHNESVELEESEIRKKSSSGNTEHASFSSDDSFDSHAAAYTEAAILATLAANSETAPCLAALENRIAELEHVAMPTYDRPWRIEVVILPWGRDLRGIWFSSTESTQQSMANGTQLTEEWAPGQPMPHIDFKTATGAAWTTESIQAWAKETQEWLSPKACGPSGAVFQRLASRGLVQEVLLTSPDAYSILGAISKTFEHVFESIESSKLSSDEQFAALSERFIPLRKVRKSSRLRFLSPAEMVTPAMWTAEFLAASVCMRLNDGNRRLYLSTPEAYIQSLERSSEWTWPRLRQLPLYNATPGERSVSCNRVAIEACWTYNDRIDRPLSTQSSMSSSGSRWSTSNTHFLTATVGGTVTENAPDNSPAFTGPKRRIVSADSGIGILMSNAPSNGLISSKRRRLSSPQEPVHGGLVITPRLSREPPSPFTIEHLSDSRSQGTAHRKRGNTPFAYATPHSHNNQSAEHVIMKLGDGDNGAYSDVTVRRTPLGEDEWQGVEDDLHTDGFDEGRSRYTEDDQDDDDYESDVDSHDSDVSV